MASRNTRLTPVVTVNPAPLSGKDAAVLSEYDEHSARLAVEGLALAEDKLRRTAPWRPLRRLRLGHEVREHRLALRDLGADMDVPPPPLAAQKAALRHAARRSFAPLMVLIAVAAGLVGAVKAISVTADAVRQSPQEIAAQIREDGAQARRDLEIVAEAQFRFQADHDGRYTANLYKLYDHEPAYSDTRARLYDADSVMAITLTERGYRVDRVDDPRFGLVYRYGGQYEGVCAAPRQAGCVSGRWMPTITVR